jgi:Domain of unknown function (DUF3846)
VTSDAVRTLQIDPDGTMRLRRIKTDVPDDLQAAVGGYIEAVTGRDWHAYLNEDGNSLGLSGNPLASVLLRYLGRPVGMVVGTVVFLGNLGSQEYDVPPYVVEAARVMGEIEEEA